MNKLGVIRFDRDRLASQFNRLVITLQPEIGRRLAAVPSPHGKRTQESVYPLRDACDGRRRAVVGFERDAALVECVEARAMPDRNERSFGKRLRGRVVEIGLALLVERGGGFV